MYIAKNPEHKLHTIKNFSQQLITIQFSKIIRSLNFDKKTNPKIENQIHTPFIIQQGKTEVKSREGPTDYTYRLDEGLVEFGTAVNDSDFGRAILFLESLGDKPAAKAMWHNLANIALQQQNLRVSDTNKRKYCYSSIIHIRLRRDVLRPWEMLQKLTIFAK